MTNIKQNLLIPIRFITNSSYCFRTIYHLDDGLYPDKKFILFYHDRINLIWKYESASASFANDFFTIYFIEYDLIW